MHQKFISLLGAALEIAASRKDFELVHSLALAAKTFSTKAEEEKILICSSLTNLIEGKPAREPIKTKPFALFELAAVEFSHFPPLEVDLCKLIKHVGFTVDSSWHNNACPHFSTVDLKWSLWVDHPESLEREYKFGDRFSITENDSDGTPLEKRHYLSAETLDDLTTMLAEWSVGIEFIEDEIKGLGFELCSTGGGCETWYLKSGKHHVILTAEDGSTGRKLNRLDKLWLGYYQVGQDQRDHVDLFESTWEKVRVKVLEFKSGKWAESQSDKPASSE